MKSSKNTFYLLLALMLSIVSCRPKSIDIELEQLDQKPVIWSQIIPGNIVVFYFSRSFSSLNENQDDTGSEDFLNQILVENGSLTITHNGNTEDLLQLSSGIWASDGISTPLITEDFYTITGIDELLEEEISATTQLLPTITMSDLFDIEIIEGDSASMLRIEYHINDVPGNNWYLVNAYSGNLDNFGNPVDTTANSTTEVAWQITTDQTYDTFDISNTITIFDYQNDTIIMTLTNITEDYYNYLALRERGGSIFNQLTAEPINYPSNIENGYGYFNLVIPDFKVVIVE